MRGFIRRRGDAWELRVYLGQDAVIGKKRYATKSVRGSRAEAERVLARMVTGADQGTYARTSAPVGELLERWFAQAVTDYSPKTVRETRGYLDRNLSVSGSGRGPGRARPGWLSWSGVFVCRAT